MASLTRHRRSAAAAPAAQPITESRPHFDAARAQARTEALIEGSRRQGLSLCVRYQEGGRVREFKDLYEETVGRPSRRAGGACIWPANGSGNSYLVLGARGDWALGAGCDVAIGAWDLEILSRAQRSLSFALGQALGLNPSAVPVLGAAFFSLPSPQKPVEPGTKSLHPKCLTPLFLKEYAEFSNRFGVPSPSGGICFEDSSSERAAVVVEGLAMVPAKAAKQRVRPGDAVILISSCGGTGGAAFDEVQQTLAEAFRKGLFHRAVAVGIEGLAEAVLSLSSGRGVSISLDKAASRGRPADPEELWFSKQDGLFLLAASRGAFREIDRISKERGLDAREIGIFSDKGCIEASWNGAGFVCVEEQELSRPPRRPAPLKAAWSGVKAAKRGRPAALQAGACLRAIMGDLAVAGREWLVRQMDFEAQGHTVIKPLQGLRHDGPGDACVLWPRGLTGDAADHRGFAYGFGLSTRLLAIDPSFAASFACDEALRNVACVGADAAKAGFWVRGAWPEWAEGERLGVVARWLQGLGAAAAGFGVPVVSHQSRFGGEGSFFTVSTAAPLADMRKAVTLDVKGPGNPVYLVGHTGEEIDGSLYAALYSLPGDGLPKIFPRQAMAAFKAVGRAIASGLVLSAHDLSDGGLAVAAAQMGFSGEFGLHLDLDLLPRPAGAVDDLKLLFAETPSRILIEARSEREKDLVRLLRGLPARRIGETIANPILKIKGLDGSVLLEESLSQLKALWQRALPEALGVAAKE